MDNINQRLITGGRIFTADPENPWAESIVIEGSRITFFGDTAGAHSAYPNAELIDIKGGLVIPGFIDGHVHVTMTGAAMLKAQLRGSGSLEEIQHRVHSWAEAHPDEPRVLATNWVHADIPNAAPTKEMLDSIVPDRPAYLEAFDFHSSWVNSAALAELGITSDTQDPVGGRIVRDADTGEATGHLMESASTLYVWPLLANVDDEVREAHITTALTAYASSGITSVVEMALEEDTLGAMAKLQAAGKLTVRIVAHMIIWRTGDPLEE